MSDTHGGQPAGWYADPDMANTVRYWDGTAWTEHRAPSGPDARPAPGGLGEGAPIPGNVPTDKKPDNTGKVVGYSCLGIVGLLLLLIVIGAIAGSLKGDDSSGDEYGARDVCQQFVKDRLKSPSTADFSDTDAVSNPNGSWTVTGSVDSQNGFGAMIRNTYICTVEPSGGDNWHLDNLDFSGN